MGYLARPDGVVLHHESAGPEPHGVTFVFFNALTGDGGMWRQHIAPALEARGHGWLTFDYRGQKESPVAREARIDLAHLLDDARAVIEAEEPIRPVFVGLSIGGLFAARLHHRGTRALGLLLINTLREPGPRLSWLSEAMYRCALAGGLPLLRDLYLPLLCGGRWLAASRSSFLGDVPYRPLDAGDAEARLLAVASEEEWDFPWEKLDVPVLVLTGLEDRVFHEEAAVRRLCGRIPQALRVDVADAGHLLPMEDPEAVTEACLALAGRIGAPIP